MSTQETVPPFGGKKLFNVEVENDLVVLASDRDEAEAIAKKVVTRNADELDWHDASYGASEVRKYLPHGWANALPYGDEDKFTCKQIIEAWEEYERTRPLTKAELEAKGQVPLIQEHGTTDHL